jgi:hypothetical protein
VIVFDCAGLVFGCVIVIIGAVISFLITYVLLLIGHHHVSLILMITFVTHSGGVNHVDNAFTLSNHVVHPFIEYATAVLGDGHVVSVHVQVTTPA